MRRDIIPIASQAGPGPIVYFASQAPDGSITEHRVFDVDPRPGCALCYECGAHKEADGRFYCVRQATGSASSLPWCTG